MDKKQKSRGRAAQNITLQMSTLCTEKSLQAKFFNKVQSEKKKKGMLNKKVELDQELVCWVGLPAHHEIISENFLSTMHKNKAEDINISEE